MATASDTTGAGLVPSRFTVGEIVDALVDEGRADERLPFLVRDALLRPAPGPAAWVVRAITVGAAWVSAALFLAFAFTLNFMDELQFKGAGIGLAGLALLIGQGAARAQTDDPADIGIVLNFVEQFGLATAVLARLLVFVGLWLSGPEYAIAAMILLDLVFLALYPEAMHRFLSLVGLAVWPVLLARVQEVPGAGEAVVALLAAAAVASFLGEARLAASPVWRWRRVLSYGLATAACAGVLALVIVAAIAPEPALASGRYVASVSLGALLAVLVTQIARTLPASRTAGGPPRWRLAAAYGSIVLLTAASSDAPGVLLGLILLLLGFRVRDLTLVGLGTAYLVAFLAYYYYSLDVTLLQKSVSMFAGGAILLCVRYYVGSQMGPPTVPSIPAAAQIGRPAP